MKPRVVFDTGVVLSALVFSSPHLVWLREHWKHACTPLLSRDTLSELLRVLNYPKFRLTAAQKLAICNAYVPYCESVPNITACAVVCRDPKDQPLLDLSFSGKASALVTGDADLLTLVGSTPFSIEAPSAYRERLADRKS